MNKSPSRAIILMNLGSPASPQVPDVARYLSEFLMDPRVIDLPWLLRFILVRLLIVHPMCQEWIASQVFA